MTPRGQAIIDLQEGFPKQRIVGRDALYLSEVCEILSSKPAVMISLRCTFIIARKRRRKDVGRCRNYSGDVAGFCSHHEHHETGVLLDREALIT